MQREIFALATGFCIFLEGCIEYKAQCKSQLWHEYTDPGNVLDLTELP